MFKKEGIFRVRVMDLVCKSCACVDFRMAHQDSLLHTIETIAFTLNTNAHDNKQGFIRQQTVVPKLASRFIPPGRGRTLTNHSAFN